eukprot:Nk52_evm1s39 gene=Nk52_evmTU1s39
MCSKISGGISFLVALVVFGLVVPWRGGNKIVVQADNVDVTQLEGEKSFNLLYPLMWPVKCKFERFVNLAPDHMEDIELKHVVNWYEKRDTLHKAYPNLFPFENVDLFDMEKVDLRKYSSKSKQKYYDEKEKIEFQENFIKNLGYKNAYDICSSEILEQSAPKGSNGEENNLVTFASYLTNLKKCQLRLKTLYENAQRAAGIYTVTHTKLQNELLPKFKDIEEKTDKYRQALASDLFERADGTEIQHRYSKTLAIEAREAFQTLADYHSDSQGRANVSYNIVKERLDSGLDKDDNSLKELQVMFQVTRDLHGYVKSDIRKDPSGKPVSQTPETRHQDLEQSKSAETRYVDIVKTWDDVIKKHEEWEDQSEEQTKDAITIWKGKKYLIKSEISGLVTIAESVLENNINLFETIKVSESQCKMCIPEPSSPTELELKEYVNKAIKSVTAYKDQFNDCCTTNKPDVPSVKTSFEQTCCVAQIFKQLSTKATEECQSKTAHSPDCENSLDSSTYNIGFERFSSIASSLKQLSESLLTYDSKTWIGVQDGLSSKVKEITGSFPSAVATSNFSIVFEAHSLSAKTHWEIHQALIEYNSCVGNVSLEKPTLPSTSELPKLTKVDLKAGHIQSYAQHVNFKNILCVSCSFGTEDVLPIVFHPLFKDFKTYVATLFTDSKCIECVGEQLLRIIQSLAEAECQKCIDSSNGNSDNCQSNSGDIVSKSILQSVAVSCKSHNSDCPDISENKNGKMMKAIVDSANKLLPSAQNESCSQIHLDSPRYDNEWWATYNDFNRQMALPIHQNFPEDSTVINAPRMDTSAVYDFIGRIVLPVQIPKETGSENGIGMAYENNIKRSTFYELMMGRNFKRNMFRYEDAISTTGYPMTAVYGRPSTFENTDTRDDVEEFPLMYIYGSFVPDLNKSKQFSLFPRFMSARTLEKKNKEKSPGSMPNADIDESPEPSEISNERDYASTKCKGFAPEGSGIFDLEANDIVAWYKGYEIYQKELKFYDNNLGKVSPDGSQLKYGKLQTLPFIATEKKKCWDNFDKDSENAGMCTTYHRKAVELFGYDICLFVACTTHENGNKIYGKKMLVETTDLSTGHVTLHCQSKEELAELANKVWGPSEYKALLASKSIKSQTTVCLKTNKVTTYMRSLTTLRCINSKSSEYSHAFDGRFYYRTLESRDNSANSYLLTWPALLPAPLLPTNDVLKSKDHARGVYERFPSEERLLWPLTCSLDKNIFNEACNQEITLELLRGWHLNAKYMSNIIRDQDFNQDVFADGLLYGISSKSLKEYRESAFVSDTVKRDASKDAQVKKIVELANFHQQEICVMTCCTGDEVLAKGIDEDNFHCTSISKFTKMRNAQDCVAQIAIDKANVRYTKLTCKSPREPIDEEWAIYGTFFEDYWYALVFPHLPSQIQGRYSHIEVVKQSDGKFIQSVSQTVDAMAPSKKESEFKPDATTFSTDNYKVTLKCNRNTITLDRAAVKTILRNTDIFEAQRHKLVNVKVQELKALRDSVLEGEPLSNFNMAKVVFYWPNLVCYMQDCDVETTKYSIQLNKACLLNPPLDEIQYQ